MPTPCYISIEGKTQGNITADPVSNILPTLLMPEGITALKRFKYVNDND
ncbi:hypothetical protein NFF66_03190 [Proteus mirabilis]|nr:hypothetical protein [Proteus mirabilis]MBI6436079.1 hypothetical protein [Proteus mirabilis]MDF7254075.1 hypothetical protein [Proteus mirabilis]MDF7348003.1 hypothetical protein [Proteus mirabilis]